MGQSCYSKRYNQGLGDESDTEECEDDLDFVENGDIIDKEETLKKTLCDEFNELNIMGELSPHALTKFLLSLYLGRLPHDLKTICIEYLGEDTEKNLDLQYPFKSTILTTQEKYSLLSVMQRHLSNKSITFKLIYRASRDGYSAKDFHRKCDKYDYTLHVILPLSNTQTTKLAVFGGFTSIPISKIEKDHRDPLSFLFRVRSNYRSAKLLKPNIYHYEGAFQFHWKNYVKNYTHSMLSWGTKGDENKYLFIDDHCDWRNNFVGNDHLTEWQSDTIGFSVKEQQRLYFRIKEYEVYQIEQLFINTNTNSSSSIITSSDIERTNNLSSGLSSSE